MIGKAQWFYRRQYSGWGLTPRTWQGFVYVGALVGLGFLIQTIGLSSDVRFSLTAALIFIASLDVLHIMASISLDEREQAAEAMAERNAAWAMVAALALAIVYANTFFSISEKDRFMPVLIAVLIIGLVAKALTALFVKRRGL